MADTVDVILRLQQLRQFVSGTDQAARSIKNVGTEAEKSGKRAGIGWKGIAKWAGGAAAVYGAYRFLKGSAKATEDLAKDSMTLHRTTGMNIKTSSEWASILKSRGVQTRTVTQGLAKFSQEIEKTRIGTKKHNSALEQLGIGSKDVAVQTGNTNDLLLRTADRFSKMTNPAKRAALAQKLFGRAGRDLQPLLYKGSKEINKQRGLMDKYGATLNDKTSKAALDEIAHQRELRVAMMGVQLQMGQAMLPVLLAFTKLLVAAARAMAPLTKNATLMKVAIAALVAVFLVYKIAMLAAAVATTVFGTAALPVVAVVLAIVVAIAALVAIGYLLYKNWGWIKKKAVEVWAAIRNAVVSAWNWIKKTLMAGIAWLRSNWYVIVLALLAGPFGLAVGLVIKHFARIKQAAKAGIDFVIRQFQRAIDFVKSIPGKIGSPFKNAFKAAKGGGVPFVPGVQHGGTIAVGGTALVGERGPEIVSLPRAAQVTPLTGAPGQAAGTGAGTGVVDVHTHVYLDRREIAQAIGQYSADKVARR